MGTTSPGLWSAYSSSNKLSRATKKMPARSVSGFMAAEKLKRMRGWRLKPSNWFRDGCRRQPKRSLEQSGASRFTRRPVFWDESGTVKASDGYGPEDGFAGSN